MAVRLDQRDEALRELLAQLTIGNGIALLIASVLAYRVARAALDPVERYRAQAERITHGAPGLRLNVPAAPNDELTKLGDTLNGMIDALERAAERQKEFIDDASHELRTPLTTLAAEISVARRRKRTPEEYDAALARLSATTDQLIELTDTLLSLGALGTSTPYPEDLQTVLLLSAAAERAKNQLHGDPLRLVHVVDSNDVIVVGDRVLLERALGNLADNAVRHGSGNIVFAAHTAESHPIVQLTVHDEGRIDASFLRHAAKRFSQGEQARGDAGSGLGLSLVEAIAVAHGGQLRICSAGEHHGEAASAPWIRRIPCVHEPEGTTITLLVPTGNA
jgi:signal transduction histidine kinase